MPAPALSPDDRELVERCRRELPYVTEAFEQLVRRHEVRVLSVCRRMLASREDAEEVAQDTFMRVFHGLRQFDGRSSFATWLYRIALNLCTTRRERNTRNDDRLAEYALGSRPGTGQEAGDPAAEAGDDVEHLLRSLTPEERELMVLRHVGQLSVKQIGGTLGLGAGAVRMRIHRAETKLRATLAAATSI
jgi:RNA polymerase sigma-70 factor (ECF subfamily)